MTWADMAIISLYVFAFIVTQRRELVILTAAMSVSAAIFWGFGNDFRVEYLYFLTQSSVWVVTAALLRGNYPVSLSALLMAGYECLVAVESFIWQFITPVETPIHGNYAEIIIAIHAIILYTAVKRGKKIGYTHGSDSYRFFDNPDLQMLEVHHQRGKR